MVTVDQVEKGIAAYLDTEIMPNLPESGLERLAIGVGVALILRNQKGKLAQLQNNSFVQLMGIFDEDGNVDVDILRDEVKNRLPKGGLKIDVPKLGAMKFGPSDIDKLYDCITAL